MPSAHATPADAAPSADLSRRVALGLLLVVLLVSLGLRLWNRTYGLPHVFHSDYRQVVQAAKLLRDGSFVHVVSYNPGDTFVYAAGDALYWSVRHLLGAPETWTDFVARLRFPGVHHAIGRLTDSCLGSLLAIAVYLMARVRFSRRVAVLAAAIASFAPMQIIFSHQTRIHVPAIVVLAFASIPVLRIAAGDRKPRTALLAGVGAGLAVQMVQYGFLLLGTAGLLTLLLVRPARAAGRTLLLGALGFLVTYAATMALIYGTGVASLPGGDTLTKDFWTLGMTKSSVSLRPAVLGRLVLGWIGTEPVRTLALLVFALAAMTRKLAARDALIYGLYPLIAFSVIGAGIGSQPRYAMSNTPFLAVLAAAGALSLRRALPRRLLVALLLLVPLATSARYDWLLDSVDTRVAVDGALARIASAQMPVAINFELALDAQRLPEHVETVPPRGDYRAARRGPDWGIQLLARSPAQVFIRPTGPWAGAAATDARLAAIGFQRYGAVIGSMTDTDCLPDAPQQPGLAIWTARRTGPTIEVWVRSEPARRRLEQLLPVGELARLGAP